MDPPFRRCAHHHQHQRGQRKRETSVADPRICQHLRSKRDQNLVTQPLVKDAELQESESRNLVDVDLRCLQCSCTLPGRREISPGLGLENTRWEFFEIAAHWRSTTSRRKSSCKAETEQVERNIRGLKREKHFVECENTH